MFNHFLITVSLADVEPLEPKLTARQAQQTSMEQALFSETNVGQGLERVFFRSPGGRHHCCQWRGVECTAGKVTTFVLCQRGYSRYSVRLPWLPHTLEFLHMDGFHLDDAFSVEQLPRSLRSCFLQNIGFLGDGFDHCRPSAVVNFANLPQNLEEFYVHSYRDLFGTLYISHMPPMMHVCVIATSSLRSVVAQNSGLSECLEIFHASRLRIGKLPKGIQAHCIDEKHVDERLRVSDQRPSPNKCLRLGWHAREIGGEVAKELAEQDMLDRYRR